MATVSFVRLRAGFYSTRDAQWRIVRRAFVGGRVFYWYVEQWSPRHRQYVRLQTFKRLADARAFVRENMLPVVEES